MLTSVFGWGLSDGASGPGFAITAIRAAVVRRHADTRLVPAVAVALNVASRASRTASKSPTSCRAWEGEGGPQPHFLNSKTSKEVTKTSRRFWNWGRLPENGVSRTGSGAGATLRRMKDAACWFYHFAADE